MDTYEKKYKEALERAKDYYKANQKLGDSDENEVLSDIFPELKESSEEKVRKEIIKLIKFYYGSSLALKHTVSKDEMVAWLEKQDEQRSKLVDFDYNAKDSDLQEVTYFIPNGFHAEMDGNKVVIKQGEQKPAKWSEEDEHRFKDTIYFLDTAKKHYASIVELDACIDWLKSLKQRMEEQQ